MASWVIRSVTENFEVSKTKEDKVGLERSPEYRDAVTVQNHSTIILEDKPVSTQAIREYLALIWVKYQGATKALKGQILNEICRNLGVHRKAAVRLMRTPYEPRSMQGFKGGRQRKYSDQSKFHLEKLWWLMNCIAPIRMKAALPEWIESYEHKDFNAEIKAEILRMSEASIKRFLADARKELQRRQNSGTKPGLRKFIASVPIRNFEKPPEEPGHCEIDCVAHCGGSLSGEFAWTLNLTDIHTGWTECEAVWSKNGLEIKKALEQIEKRLPFPIKALYSDNGNEFMNHHVIEDFTVKGRSERIPYYRGRPYRKNDQCYIEQKNYTHVRSLFGYGRIAWKKAVNMMNNIYRREWRELQNFYLPQQKLEAKIRINAQIVRKMSLPETPFARLMNQLDDKGKRLLLNVKKSINPIRTKANLTLKTRQLFGYFKNTIPKSERGKIVL